MLLKQKVVEACAQMINEKIRFLENSIHELMEGTESDAKSSAGDKHETARAMAQGEQEKLRMQLHEALLQRTVLEKIVPLTSNALIVPGSLIKTNKGYLFLSVALGKIKVEEMEVVVLSPQSPLGTKLIGLHADDEIVMNSAVYKIQSVG